ncbi:hypothetical protein ACKGJO_13365 [Gracilimonas sp. Q87]|uniref:hypothetical protein n=1 Tax=Gracilimonas sp. Q87 TaxID=3384766 RepID=UPI0039841FE6
MYIIDNKRQIERINSMVPLRKNLETFEVYYHDPSTGEMWKSFFPKGYQKHKGPKLLRPEPLPKSLELQLEICLNSTDNSDAIGLGIECSVKPEKWDTILDLLDKNRSNYLRSHLTTFINHLGVLDPENALKDVELNPDEAGLSPEKLIQLKKRARMIKIKRFLRI